MVIYCPRCGSPNPDNAIYCQRCGYPLQKVQQTALIQSSAQNFQQQNLYRYQYYSKSNSSYEYGWILARWGTIFYGIVLFLVSIGEILYNVSNYSSGVSGSVIGAIVLSSIASAMLFLVGIIPILIGFTRDIIRWIFLAGIFIFIYFLMIGIANIYNGVSFSQPVNTANGALLIIAGIFIFLAVYFNKDISLEKKLYAIVLSIVGFFIASSISSLIYSLINSFSSLSYGFSSLSFLLSASFFNSSYSFLSVSFLLTMFSIVVILFYNNLSKYVNIFLGFAFLLFSLGVLKLGIIGISGGIPSTSGLSITATASIYISVIASIIDIFVGAMLSISALLILLNYINNFIYK